MMSVFTVFVIELVAHRAGASYLRRRGLKAHDAHSTKPGAIAIPHTTHGLHVDATPTASIEESDIKKSLGDSESQDVGHRESEGEFSDTALSQVIGVAILEFGVIFHSMIIGLTLAVSDGFVILFIVIVFHRKFFRCAAWGPGLTFHEILIFAETFEGLGLGSRLATLPLSKKYNFVAYVGAVLYSTITPLGIAIGLGLRTTYVPPNLSLYLVRH